MILIDTNVISDSSRPRPDPSVGGTVRSGRLIFSSPVLAELATRDVADFAGLGIEIVNPFEFKA